jgi:ABC-2 type transport system ATP-binding protein
VTIRLIANGLLTPRMTNAIEVDELKKVYRANNPVRALDGVSFSVAPGSIAGLLGPNGAGKSTLVKILSTIAPATSGRAAVLGIDVARHPLAARQQMAVVLQQTAAETLLTVRDNLLIYARLHGIHSREAMSRMHALADDFDLNERLRDTVQELSIGTKRRIQVAKIFMLDSPVIILDEATTGMDPLMKRRVINRIRAEVRNGRSVLLTTHVLSEAEELCDTIMIIDHGRMLASGTLSELRRISHQMFRVSLSFTDAGDIANRLQALKPVELKLDGRAAEMLFRGDEASLLAGLAEISRSTPIQQFEVRGPNLEEIFVALVKDSSDARKRA